MFLSKHKKSATLLVVLQAVMLFVSMLCLNHTLTARYYFNFDYITQEQGLSNSNVEAITQDKDGFIWFGTHRGIFKFDGLNSQQFLPDGRPGSLQGADIYDLLVTSDNTLWAATTTAGIARFDRATNTFTHITDTSEPHSIAHYRAKAMLDFDHGIWVLTENGIERLDPQSFETERVGLLAQDGSLLVQYAATDLITHADTILTIYNNHLYRLNRNLMQFERYDFPDYHPYAYSSELDHYRIFSTRENRLFIYTELGVFYVDDEKKLIRREPLKYSKEKEDRLLIRDILVDSHDSVWVVTLGQGMYFRLAQDDVYTKVPVGIGSNQLNTLQLYTLFEDKTNNIWLGTSGSFVAKFRATQDVFPYYSNYYDVGNTTHTYSIWNFLDHGEQLFISADSGVFTFDQGKKNTAIKPLLTSERYRQAYALMSVGDSLYIGAQNGLYEYLPNGVVNDISHYIQDNINIEAREDPTVLQLAQSASQLFIGTFFGLLIQDKDTGVWTTYSSKESANTLKDDWVLVMEYQDAQELLWIGSSKGAEVVSVKQNKDVSELNRILDQGPDAINDFYFDQSGHVWIASNSGLYRYTPENVLLEYSYFPDNIIRSLQVVDGVVWMTVGRGLISAPVDDLENYRYYTREDGLYNTGYTQAAAYYSEREQKFYFGGDRGFVSFSPDINLPVSKAISPRLSSINLVNTDGLPDVTQRILRQKTLEHFENSIRFNFAYLDFKAPKKNRFQFKLEGFDNNWSELTSESSATYTNLSSADYIFRVKAFDANYVLSDRELSVDFTIKKAWWATEAALLGYILLLLLSALYFGHWLRKAQEQHKHQQIQKNKEEFIHGYNRYALSLTELHSYQTLVRKFLDQAKLITGAKFLRYQQFLNDSPLEISIGDLQNSDEYELVKLELMSNKSVAQLSLSEVSTEALAETTADIQILFQQMIILQTSFLDRLKYNWNDNFSSITGLFNKVAFVKIVADEFERAEKNNTSVVFFEWYVDKSRFRDNELLKRIQLLSYGDQVKYIFGDHVIATYLESDDSEPRFLIFLCELDASICDQYEASLRKVMHENRTTQEHGGVKFEKLTVMHVDAHFDAFLDGLQ